MAIYELSSEEIRAIPTTTFAEEGILERQHLQRMLRSKIETVAPGVMVLTEEFGEWEGSKRRIDLLALDKDGNLVVIELKRDEDGAHMELQALRYAAMVSTMTFTRAVDAHQKYLAKLGRDDDARAALLQHLDWDEPREDDFAQDVRVVLVSANFSTEITSTVMWLNDRGLDIRCVRVQPYSLEGRVLLDVQQIIPLPEAAVYQVQLKEKTAESRASKGEGRDTTRYDLQISGEPFRRLAKRNMIYLAVQAAIGRGAKRDAFTSIRPGKWLVVDGKVSSRDAFVERVREKLGAPGKSFEEHRWFLDDGQLFHDDSSTFALSSQWIGPDVVESVKEIAELYPDLCISYEPTPSGA